ncbi:MAG: hypothetical protein ACFCVE_04600 [Phycisphaerae bacterium]
MISRLLSIAGLAGLLLVGGCANNAQTGAAVGAGLGALGGAIIGNNANGGGRGEAGALIGAGVGAAGGYIIGNEQDKAEARQYQRHDARYDAYHPQPRHHPRYNHDRYNHDRFEDDYRHPGPYRSAPRVYR